MRRWLTYRCAKLDPALLLLEDKGNPDTIMSYFRVAVNNTSLHPSAVAIQQWQANMDHCPLSKGLATPQTYTGQADIQHECWFGMVLRQCRGWTVT